MSFSEISLAVKPTSGFYQRPKQNRHVTSKSDHDDPVSKTRLFLIFLLEYFGIVSNTFLYKVCVALIHS